MCSGQDKFSNVFLSRGSHGTDLENGAVNKVWKGLESAGTFGTKRWDIGQKGAEKY